MSKHILVLARRDVYEAIRVAAGLTIRNNTVDFVFMKEPPLTPEGKVQNFEMLELTEIRPQSLIDGIPDTTPCEDLSALISNADRVVSF
ncbi:hypothetical protein RYZ26_18760 [Terasakiella sp. A23]|uniref:hypothetical protein n=1 Tax=Terasakiella sp. FCG-A23 TaxID=3080561 RepID=UPI002954E1E3|nr:hypothetical protein [Terasakiella sp. A23]MDV7341649.1 hypothetical protein [Terasakiella sp. A23]